jgi:exosome complex component RRP46
MEAPIVIETSSLQKVDGSASWKQGLAKVICSVSGPMEVKPRGELPVEATLELVVRPVTGLSSTREALLEDRLHGVLSSIILKNLYPRSLIQMVVQILEPGEGEQNNVLELAAGINSAVVALIDAAIPLHGLIASTAIAISKSNEFIIWPSPEELNEAKSTHCVAYEIIDNQVTRLLLCESTGLFTKEQLMQCLNSAQPECMRIYQKIRDAVGEKLNKDFVWRS